jgi:hypothetical protein
MDTQQAGPSVVTPARSWRTVLIAGALGQIVVSVAAMVVNTSVVPLLVVISALLAAGLGVLRGNRRAGVAVLGVVSALHVVGPGRADRARRTRTGDCCQGCSES